MTALGQAVGDSAHVVDEKLGAKYGDYARTASRSLQEAAASLDQKSIDELGEDARTMVRKSPGCGGGYRRRLRLPALPPVLRLAPLIRTPGGGPACC